MPGVPSGKGCNGCRRQKKKCDQAVPSCSRCVRLGIPCIGAGQQRYKFMEPKSSTKSSTDGSPLEPINRDAAAGVTDLVSHAPSNQLTMFRNKYMAMIHKSADIRYNLAMSFGEYLVDVPQRLGTNEALDAAAMALIDAHSQQCLGHGVTIEGITKYSTALRKLRYCLDDPTMACTSETLCAVMILQLCQTFMGLVEGNWSGHAEGMAQMLIARGSCKPTDPFERKLLGSLRGVLLFEGMMNSKIRLSLHSWRELAESTLCENGYGDRLMRCLCLIPYYIDRRARHSDLGFEEMVILADIRANYESLRLTLTELEKLTQELISKPATDKLILADAGILRIYGLSLTIAVILNCILGAEDLGNTQLSSENYDFAYKLIAIAELGKRYRPLGGMLMMVFLGHAWMATDDPSMRALAQQGLQAYRSPCSTRNLTQMSVDGLEWAAQRLRLQNPEIPPDYHVYLDS